MNARLAAIHKRRTVLLARAAAQRDEIATCAHPWQTPLSLVDRVLALFHRLRAHPLSIPVGAFLLFSMGRSRKSLWASRLWTGWQLYSSLYNNQRTDRR